MKNREITSNSFLWALEALCTLHRKPFSGELARQQLAPPYRIDTLGQAAQGYDFDAVLKKIRPRKLHHEAFPLVAWLQSDTPTAPLANKDDNQAYTSPALILQADGQHLLIVEPHDPVPRTIAVNDFTQRYLGHLTRITPKTDPATSASTGSPRNCSSTRNSGTKSCSPRW